MGALGIHQVSICIAIVSLAQLTPKKSGDNPSLMQEGVDMLKRLLLSQSCKSIMQIFLRNAFPKAGICLLMGK